MTAWHVDEQGRSWRPFSRFTCPNHPDGPPTLPAEGYEREELRVDEAYDGDEIAALQRLVALGRTGPRVADRFAAAIVEEALGLCCIGHRWKVAGFRQMSKSDVTLSKLEDVLRSMPLLIDSSASVLLAELSRAEYDVEVKPGHPLPVRIPLVVPVHHEGAGIQQIFPNRYSLDPAKPPTVE